jgi:hypothetical protein
MSTKSKREYLERIYGRYQRGGLEHKRRILDEFCENCGYHRKSALRLLNRPLLKASRKRSGPEPIYPANQILKPLLEIWKASDQLCSKRLVVALPLWLPFTKGLDEATKQKLLGLSPSTIDRLLRPCRVRYPRRGLGTTKPGTLLHKQVPLRGGPPNTGTPGHVEVDTVAHCGTTTAGNYVNSITFTELFSGWTEIRATWNKGSAGILEQVRAVEKALPVAIINFHTDNGTEFLNWPLYEHLTGRKEPITFTRSRAYRKNDNAHVEQKNWTHVRELFAFERFEHPPLVDLMNDLYTKEWSLFQNHFRPSLKLESKEKVRSKTKRTYFDPATPYQRLLDSSHVSDEVKNNLKQRHASLNPFALKSIIERKLKTFFTTLNQLDLRSMNPPSSGATSGNI